MGSWFHSIIFQYFVTIFLIISRFENILLFYLKKSVKMWFRECNFFIIFCTVLRSLKVLNIFFELKVNNNWRGAIMEITGIKLKTCFNKSTTPYCVKTNQFYGFIRHHSATLHFKMHWKCHLFNPFKCNIATIN